MSLASIFDSQPAVGAIGNAMNAYANNRAVGKAVRQSMEQLNQSIARQDENRARDLQAAAADQARQIAQAEAVRARQLQMAQQEQARQQIMARASGDAFADSLGQFQGDFNQRIGDASSQIADFYREFLQRKTAQEQVAASIAPQATGPTADRQASAMSEAGAEVMGDAGRMANAQGFSEAMRGVSEALGGNEQLAALINNFARGSAGAGQAEIDAQAENFIASNPVRGPEFVSRDIQVRPNTMLADMFVGLAGIGSQYMQNRPGPNQPTVGVSDHGGRWTPNGPSAGFSNHDTGMVNRLNLGIR